MGSANHAANDPPNANTPNNIQNTTHPNRLRTQHTKRGKLALVVSLAAVLTHSSCVQDALGYILGTLEEARIGSLIELLRFSY